jgi:hypothetical protein
MSVKYLLKTNSRKYIFVKKKKNLLFLLQRDQAMSDKATVKFTTVLECSSQNHMIKG